MSRKSNPLHRFVLTTLPLSLMLLMLISGCRQDDENDSNSPAPAYVVPLTDNNNDGAPDGWGIYGSKANLGDYELTLDTTTGHTDETSLLLQTDKNIEEDGFGSASRELSNINQFKGYRVQLSGYIKTENVSDLAEGCAAS